MDRISKLSRRGSANISAAMKMISFFVLQTWLMGLLFISRAHSLSLTRSTPDELLFIQDLEFSSSPVSDHSGRDLDVSFSLRNDDQRRIRLSLSRNEDVYRQPVSINYLQSDGTIRTSESIPQGSHLIFQGLTYVSQLLPGNDHGINNAPERGAGWARMSFHVKQGVLLGEGTFSIDHIKYHVQTDYNYRSTWRAGEPELPLSRKPFMIVWRDSLQDGVPRDDLQELRKRAAEEEAGCGFDKLEFNRRGVTPTSNTSQLEERQFSGSLDDLDLTESIGSKSGCPNTRLIALLGIATDCTYTAGFESDDDLRQHVLAQINSASQIYEDTFNVQLRVRNLTISDRDCPSDPSGSSTPWNRACSSDVEMEDRLQMFSSWRADSDDNRNAVWTLLTTCSTSATVGIAWMGTVCNDSRRSRRTTTPSANIVARTAAEWQVIAHEIGHNFGAVHDCMEGCRGQSTSEQENCCPLSSSTCNANGGYLMNPSSSRAMTEFSPCTIGAVCTAMGRGLVETDCLRGNEDVPPVSTGECGNGVVEEGEDCDCGGEDGCRDNPCCNPTTCKFTDNSVCDPSNDECCTNQCQLASSGTVCRESTGECDPEEVCSGSSASCTRDIKARDGQSCGNESEGTACASGQCTSRTMQCSMALFNSTSNNDARPCDENSCELSCFGSSGETCQDMGMYYLDGTSCGSGRFCYRGRCGRDRSGSDGGNGSDAAAWIERNRTLFIVICTVGGVLVLAALVGCIACSCGRKRKRAKHVPPREQTGNEQPRSPAVLQRPMSQYQASPPEPVHQSSYTQGQRYA